MPTEIEAQIYNYFEWVELRTGHDLRPPGASRPVGDAPVGLHPEFEVESSGDHREAANPSTQRPRRHRSTILLAAAASLVVVAGLVAIGSTRTGSPTAPLAQSTLPEPGGQSALPGWGEHLAIKVFMRPDATETQLSAVQSAIGAATDVIVEWSYLDAEASLQEAERVLADEPATFELLDVDNIPTVFDLVATPAATDDALDQLVMELRGLPGVLELVTAEQARRQPPLDPQAVESSETVVVTTSPEVASLNATPE